MNEWHSRTDEADPEELTEFRVDRRARLRPLRITREGFHVVDGFAARPGVLKYRRKGVIVRELVLPEMLRQSSPSLQGKPITLKHPKGDKVTPQNVSETVAGSISDVEIDEPTGMIRTELTIMRADAIRAAKTGTVELSLGYGTRIDRTSGVHPEYGPYDQIQAVRVYNHLALCDNARGGSQLRIRTDAAIELPEETPHKGRPMIISPLLIALFATLGVRTDSIDPENPDPQLREANATAGKLVEEKDSLKGRVDAFEGAERTDEQVEADHLAYFNERIPLVTLAGHYNLDSIDAMPNEELRKAVAIEATPTADKDGSDAYYKALVTVAAERLDSADAADKANPYERFGTGFGEKPKGQERVDSEPSRPPKSATRSYLDSIKDQNANR